MEFPGRRGEDLVAIPTRIGTLLSGAVVVAATAMLGIHLSQMGGGVAAPWLANAFGLLLCLRSGPGQSWKWLSAHALGIATAHLVLVHGNPVGVAGSVLANSTEVVIALFLARRFGGPLFQSPGLPSVLGRIALVAGVASPVGSALGAASLHGSLGHSWGALFLDRWSGDALGMIIVLFPGLTMGARERQFWKDGAALLRIAVVVPILAASVFALEAIGGDGSILLALPFLVIAVWGRYAEVMPASGLAIVLVALALLVGHPLDFADAAAYRELWATLAATFLVSAVVAFSLREQRRRVHAARRMDERFRALLDASGAGEILIDREGRVLEANRSFGAFVGCAMDEIRGRTFTGWIQARDQDEAGRAWLGGGAGPLAEAMELRYRTEGDSLLVGRTLCSAVPGDDGIRLLHVEDVTEARQAEEELRRSRAELRMVMDNIPDSVAYWDRDLCNRFGNRAYRERYGGDAAEMPGRTLPEIVGEEEFELRRKEVAAVLEGAPQLFEAEILEAEGPRHFLFSYVPDVQDGLVRGFFSVVSDITQLRVAQKARLDALARLRDVIDGASEFAIIATNIAGTIDLFSAGAEKMLGYSADEMVGKSSLSVLHLKEEIAERSRDILSRNGRILGGFDVLVDSPRHGQSETREWTWVRKDGARVPVQVYTTVLRDHGGRVNGFLAVARDISRDLDSMRILENARHQAERASQLKGEFVANMSHEIRTPMNTVLGMAQLLETTNLTPNQKRYLDMIRKSGRSLLGILDDILDFAKIEAGKLRIESVGFRLDDVMEHLANVCAVAAQGKRLDLAIVVDPEVPVDLVGDPLRLQQVLVNLVGNAVKFTESGGVSLHVDLLESAEGRVEIGFRIRDTGIGMTDEQQRRIFQPFSQADGSTTRKYGGTGLGLPISKHLVEMMGGRIGLNSRLGSGTEFFISLTFPVQPGGDILLSGAPRDDVHLLVIDDDPAARQGIEWAALRYGWRVTAVANLDDALATLRASAGADEPFSAILVDSWLPGWDDREGIARLRRACPLEIPLIRLSDFMAGRGEGDSVRVLDGMVVKPVTPAALLETVTNVLSGRTGDEMPASVSDESAVGTAGPLDGVRILLVEDNAFNQVVATETLRNLGASVEIAENGRVACDRLASDASSFDVVLMDVQMPVMDGYAATRHIREVLGSDIPVLAMTAGVLPSDRDRCIAAGMDDFVTKPFRVDVLEATILRSVEGRDRVALREVPRPPDAGQSEGGDVTVREGTDVAAGQVVDGTVPGVFEPLRMVEMLGAGDGAEALVRKLVGQFLELAPKNLLSGREALERGDLEEAMRAYHNLKSTSASLGALALSAAAKVAEGRLAEPDGGDPVPSIAAVEEEFAKVEVLAGRWLSAGC